MKFKLMSVVALFSATALLSSCEDLIEKNETTPDGSVPYVTVSSPSEGRTYNAGSEIRVSTIVTDKDKVKDFSVAVTNASKEEVFKQVIKTSRLSVGVDTAITETGLAAGDYKLLIKAVDGRTNTTEKEINFSVK
ncbi:MAG: hypothetical protein LPK19_01700 [Hymenobacteraceae bacterium]|nr:hypothetical protein [Hymenobacteraceae bacterium]MDX5510923.1 hypothetical protein [Hymenobacteraceae bacterium]